MRYDEFINKLELTNHGELDPCLRALWHDANGDWQAAHEIVQSIDSTMAARIHAYLHRKEGDIWNSKYWHRVAGTRLNETLSLDEEWEMLVRQLTDNC